MPADPEILDDACGFRLAMGGKQNANRRAVFGFIFGLWVCRSVMRCLDSLRKLRAAWAVLYPLWRPLQNYKAS